MKIVENLGEILRQIVDAFKKGYEKSNKDNKKKNK